MTVTTLEISHALIVVKLASLVRIDLILDYLGQRQLNYSDLTDSRSHFDSFVFIIFDASSRLTLSLIFNFTVIIAFIMEKDLDVFVVRLNERAIDLFGSQIGRSQRGRGR